MSKESRKTPVVQMGLFIDDNGIPVSYDLFPVNTQDKTTFKQMIDTFVNKDFSGRVIVVADNGINTQGNFYLLTEEGNGYIVSNSVKRSWTKLREWALTEDYTLEHDGSFKYKSREINRKIKHPDDKTKKKTL